jgi:biotin synthase
MTNLTAIEHQVLDRGEAISAAQARELVALPDAGLPALISLAHRVRLRYCGDAVEVESLISAKTGGCPEDCAFCSQSARFPTRIETHPFLSTEQVLASARSSEELGATQFCIVVAVRGPDDRLMGQVLDSVAAIRRETSLDVHCSLGILTREQARALADAGVERYNHNLETARSFFPKIVSTHTWDERAETCRLAQEAGMELCSGGIFGMGETWEQRIEFACELREVGPVEIPLNFLNPRPGTPLGEQPLLAPLEAIRVCAIWRLFFPRETLRYAGGREAVLRDLQALGLLSGVNGLIMGNYLTTTGRAPAEDIRMLADLGMPRAETNGGRRTEVVL